MILTHLHLTNYKQYRNLELEFREGLVGIIGKNGAGKSTLFEAILYCLFGRDESNKSLVRSTLSGDAKANVTLELGFRIAEIQYLVKREFRGKAMAVGAELYKNDLLVAKGVNPVNEELVKVLHLERDAFKRSVFSGQKELSELSDTSGEARKRMVRKMLGLDTLDEVQTRMGSDIRDLNSRIAGQRQNLLNETDRAAIQAEIKSDNNLLKTKRSALKTEAAALKKTEAEFKTRKLAFEAAEKQLNRHHALERELAQARERENGLGSQLLSLEQKAAALQQQKEKLEQDRPAFDVFLKDKKHVEALETERQKQLNKDAVTARLAETAQQMDAARARLHALDGELAQKQQTERTLLEKQQALQRVETEMDQKRAELRELDKSISGIHTSIRERSEKRDNLRELGKQGTCPTCLQPLLEGYEHALTELERQITELQSANLQQLEKSKQTVIDAGLALRDQQNALRAEADGLLAAQSRLTELSRQQQHEQQNLQRLTASLTRDELILREIGEVHFDETAYLALKRAVAAREPAFQEFQQSENYVKREFPATRDSLNQTAKNLEETKRLVQTHTAAVAELGFDPEHYLRVKTDYSSFDEALTKQSATVRQLEKEAVELENAVARREEKIRHNEAIMGQISEKLEEIELLRKLSEHLGNFKTEILERISPGISREASNLFSRITRGKYESILVDENFEFFIADGGQYYPIARFSGGEIDLANFCLRIAVTKAIMDLSGAGHQLEFLAFDEIFGSQDEERRLEMMLALNYLQEQFRQIYIVSHIESLRDYFPHLLEVQFGAEGSSAVWR